MLARGFPGNRVEPNRAGMTATTSSGGTESTAAPADAGCTANNSTRQKRPCYHLASGLMNVKRTLTLGVIVAGVAALVAGAATSSGRRAAPQAPVKTAPLEASGAALEAEIARLHERLHPTAAPQLPTRNLFAFGSSRDRRVPASAPPPPPMSDTAPVSPPMRPNLKLIGIAEDPGDAGAVVRTAIVSGSGQLFFVKEGEMLTDGFRVAAISADVMELTDLATNRPVRLVLK